MATLTTGFLGYLEETTFAVRVDPADSALRRFGLECENFPFPAEQVETDMQEISTKFGPDGLSYGNRIVNYSLPQYVVIDAKEISYIGEVSTLESTTPDKRSLITPTEPADAFSLPSRTVHIETAGVSKQLDVAGSTIQTVEYTWVKNDPRGLLAKETHIAQRVTDESPTTTLYGESSGATADPELATGANVANAMDNVAPGSAPITFGSADMRTATYYETNPKPFKLSSVILGGACDNDSGNPTTIGDNTGGTTITTNVKKIAIKVEHEFDLQNAYCYRTGTNNYGQDISDYPIGFYLKSRKVTCVLELDPVTTVAALNLDSLKKTTNKEIYIKFQKTTDANDWIVFSFAPLVGGTVSNVQVDFQGKLDLKKLTQTYVLPYACKDLTIIAGNAFDTLRSLSGT